MRFPESYEIDSNNLLLRAFIESFRYQIDVDGNETDEREFIEECIELYRLTSVNNGCRDYNQIMDRLLLIVALKSQYDVSKKK